MQNMVVLCPPMWARVGGGVKNLETLVPKPLRLRGESTFKQAVREAATICPRPGLQRKRAAAALSQAGRAGPDRPIRAIQPAGRTRRPPTGCTRQTDD